MSYHFTPTGALTDASQTASIAEIKTKTDKITITSNLNLNTMETDIATNLTGVNGILNHSIDSNLKAFVDANSAKTSMTFGTSSTTALRGDTALLQLGTSSSTALAGDTTTISASEANIITANANKLNMTVGSAMKIAVDANTSDVDFLYSRFPRQTIIRRYAFTTGDIYSDEKVKFNWDGTNRQLRFWILAIGSGEYMVGGVQKWAGTALTRVANYISQNVSTHYHYFTAPQTSGAILNSAFNLSGNFKW